MDPVALAKGGPGSVRVMFCVKGFVTVTTIVVSGPEEKLKEEVGPAVVLVGAVDMELTKKAPGELAATVLFGERGILRVVELKRLDVNDWKGPFKEKLGVVKLEEVRFEEVVEVKTVVVGVAMLPGK